MNRKNRGESGEDPRYEISKHQLICENSRFAVFLDAVKQNGEVAVEDYMSISPKTCNENQITGVVTLPVENGKYGLLKIYRPPIQDFSWELPGGFIEPNETPALSAIRELKEEAGLTCEEKNLVHLGNFFAAPGLVSGKLAVFSAETCKSVSQAEEVEFGISQFKWFSEEEVEESIEKGSIHDMATVFAIHRRTKLVNKLT
ncbi:NUDIX hydrolase [Nitrospinae bacterium]|jgi:8-oxo-dGTP pyrophosphatase MutT (NUDIX family)|nr:NUDIX hydrolase [Nitrospinota bacterium]